MFFCGKKVFLLFVAMSCLKPRADIDVKAFLIGPSEIDIEGLSKAAPLVQIPTQRTNYPLLLKYILELHKWKEGRHEKKSSNFRVRHMSIRFFG